MILSEIYSKELFIYYSREFYLYVSLYIYLLRNILKCVHDRSLFRSPISQKYLSHAILINISNLRSVREHVVMANKSILNVIKLVAYNKCFIWSWKLITFCSPTGQGCSALRHIISREWFRPYLHRVDESLTNVRHK